MPTLLVKLFDKVSIPANGKAFGGEGIDLTGYTDYRLVLRFDGVSGTAFTINEMYGPAGGIAQLNTDIANGTLNGTSLNYRRRFEVYGPTSFGIRILNHGTSALTVSGTLYAAT
jgi:hypothetical protein